MRFASPARFLRRVLPALSLGVFSGCSDSPTPLEPHVTARPHFQLGPTLTVTNTDDAGAGSLRQAIIDAPAGATIQFDAAIAGQTIVLSTAQLVVDKLLTIEGPVPSGITISGGLSVRAFTITTSGDLLLRNVSIVDGFEKFGGALVVEGKATLDHSLVANNETYSAAGGGILVHDNAELTVVNSTISGNVAPNSGGGIYSSGHVSIRNSTIAFNVSTGGGGVYSFDGSLVVRNSIIAQNFAEQDPGTANCFIEATGVSVAFAGRNLSNDQSCGTDPAMVVVASPGLAALASNGGPTKTHALGENSSAIDGGLSCTEADDQRHVARPQGARCDIGAFEFDSFGTITIALDPNASVNSKTGVATVSGTVICSATTTAVLDVEVNQTQKTTGRFTTIIKGTAGVSVPGCGPSPSSWSVAVTPSAGKFQSGAATGTALTSILVGRFLPATVTTPLKVFQLK